MEAFDIIGDVHGQAGKLLGLMELLGYRRTDGVWSHPERKAIFVGDLIDRGPRQLETIGIVRPMVESDSALCVLGNHEFNAIAWATPHPEEPAEHLRSRKRPNNRLQHRAFLAEVEGTPLHDDLIGWFKTLPLWLDLGAIRVVHPSVPTTMRQRPAGSLPLRAEVTASNGYARFAEQKDSCRIWPRD